MCSARPLIMSAFAGKAVFLSYASQDAGAARRICEALQAVGVEVWFDQSELVGGDAWDAKIRGQIGSCALFLPIVSANTQTRGEGYFRLEWKLAEDRSHLMARGIPFIVPVTIDDTTERGALVPDAFTAVQWTKLPAGETSAAFVTRVQKLLGGQGGATASVAQAAPLSHSAAPAGRSGLPLWIGGALAAVVIALVAFVVMRPTAPAPATPAGTTTKASNAGGPVPAPTPAVNPKSIAVLPFKNLSPDKDNDYFAEGVHQDLLTSLARIRDLKAISQPSMLVYRDQAQLNLRKIAVELGVATILQGSVRRAANRVKVSAQLTDARTDEHLWADDYERELTDVFAIQADIAQKIAAALKSRLLPSERAQITRRPTDNLEAYDLVLRARQLLAISTVEGRQERYEQVIRLTERALRLDPNFAEAYVPLTTAHGHLYRSAFLDATPERLAKLKDATDRASRAAPHLPETKMVRGNYFFFGLSDSARALVEFRSAQADLPNDAEVYRRIGYAERRLGRWQESLANLEKSLELDPRDEAAVQSVLDVFRVLRRFSDILDRAKRLQLFFPDTLFSRDVNWAQFELDGDEEAFSRRWPEQGSPRTYRRALSAGDFATAERVFDDVRVTRLWPDQTVIAPPKELDRATLAFLRGDLPAARTLAEKALAGLRVRKSTPRQEPAVLMAMAQAHALAGRAPEAVRDGRAALAQVEARDQLDALGLRDAFGQIFVTVGMKDEALDVLRKIFSGASVRGPHETRRHPVWSRLKDDPRFEEILRSAKPL